MSMEEARRSESGVEEREGIGEGARCLLSKGRGVEGLGVRTAGRSTGLDRVSVSENVVVGGDG